MTERPLSPCKDICALDASASVCTGCGRSVAEIAEWGSATASTKSRGDLRRVWEAPLHRRT